MNLVPAGARIAVADPPEEVRGGLHLPQGVHGSPRRGVVVKVGKDVTIGVEEGDIVFYRCEADEIEDLKMIDERCVIAYDDSMRQF